ncbi:MAG TPA: hypothetical protein VJ921_02310, partial [Vicinamibacteria bacterium]|nr:hypothetical protein [Vicinamibacteria bacterium]
RGYMPELLSGDRLKSLDAAVPHQLFSSTGLITPLLRGVVGIGSGKLFLRIPAGWDRLRVENLRHGGIYHLEWSRRRAGRDTIETTTLSPRDGSALPEIAIARALPTGAKLVGGIQLPWRVPAGWSSQTLSIRYRGGIEAVPLHEPLRSGERSSRLRVLDERVEGRSYVARVQGRRGKTYRVRLLEPEPRDIEVAIPEGAGEWGFHEIRVDIRE